MNKHALTEHLDRLCDQWINTTGEPKTGGSGRRNKQSITDVEEAPLGYPLIKKLAPVFTQCGDCHKVCADQRRTIKLTEHGKHIKCSCGLKFAENYQKGCVE